MDDKILNAAKKAAKKSNHDQAKLFYGKWWWIKVLWNKLFKEE